MSFMVEIIEPRQRFHLPHGFLTDNIIVIGMAPDPEPQHPAFGFDAERPLRKTHAHREETAYLLEAQRWMPGVVLQ
jgi:hypothetical protein